MPLKDWRNLKGYSSEILTRDSKSKAITRISETGKYSSEIHSVNEINLELNMTTANSNQKNLHTINKLMMDITAVRQTSSCGDGRPKSSLQSPGGPLLETTSNVVSGETKDA